MKIITFLEGNLVLIICTKILKNHNCMHEDIYYNIVYGKEERKMTEYFKIRVGVKSITVRLCKTTLYST